MLDQVKGWMRNRKGQGLVEYILLICLIAMVVGVAIMFFGGFIHDVFFHFVDVLAGWCSICH